MSGSRVGPLLIIAVLCLQMSKICAQTIPEIEFSLSGLVFSRGRPVPWTDNLNTATDPVTLQMRTVLCQQAQRATTAAGFGFVSCEVRSLTKQNEPDAGDLVNSALVFRARNTVTSASTGAPVTSAEANLLLQKQIRAIIDEGTALYYIGTRSDLGGPLEGSFWPMSVTGVILARGNTPIPWTNEYAQQSTLQFRTLAQSLCDSVIQAAEATRLKPSNCKVDYFTQATPNTLGSLSINVDKRDADGSILTEEVANTRLKNALTSVAAAQKDPHYFATTLRVLPNVIFDNTGVLVENTGTNSQRIWWPNKPTDCSYNYRIEWRRPERPAEVRTANVGCNTEYQNKNLLLDTAYQYRVSVLPRGSGTPTTISDWTAPFNTGSTNLQATPAEQSSVQITGNLLQRGGTPVAWAATYVVSSSPASVLLMQNLCASVIAAADSIRLKNNECVVAELRQAVDRRFTAATAYLNSDKYDLDDRMYSTSEMNAKVKAAIDTAERQGTYVNYFGSASINSESGNQVAFPFTSQTTQSVAWSNRPTDCSYRYVVQYQEAMPGAPQKLFNGGCNTEVQIPNLKKDTGYYYRLLEYRSGEPAPIIGPWSYKKYTSPVCGMWCIIGIVLGILALLLILAIIAFILYRHCYTRSTDKSSIMTLDEALEQQRSNGYSSSYTGPNTFDQVVRDSAVEQPRGYNYNFGYAQ